ncbi:serine/threonine-protein kinase [Polyangium aurulentum]|uniref:serine/threonine-protein kinase n=1 Tax=Polyangium aurulentum TaxID=2567896 RepID=UPI001F35B38B|nr:serine/threonine-protein kinase [Polyangium aurulentum]
MAGRFELVRLAGSGGMGEVYRSIDRTTGRPAAVKLLVDRQGGDAERFEREARILAGLSHPGIVRHLAHGALPSGARWLAMEWIEGEDLSRVLGRRQKLHLEEVLALGRAVAETLGFAHARGVVHRDLKPSNIHLVEGNLARPKVLDFGVAKLGRATELTRTGVLVGTPGYMAPEQARGDPGIDARADVFSLGCLLFECLTGEPAWKGDRVVAILTRILFENPPRLRTRCPELPGELEALVLRMLHKDPDARPRDGAAVADALAAIEGTTPEPLSRPAAEWRRPAALTATEQRPVAVLLIGPAPGTGPVTFGVDTTVVVFPDAELRREARALGAHCEALLDGSLALWIAGRGMATDLAARAARVALALCDKAPGRPIALAVGRAALTGQMPLGDAIDRAARTLSRHDALQRPPGGPIAVDTGTAGLLDARFDVREEGDGALLYGERPQIEGARTLLGHPTLCVGRDRELRLLEQIWDDCAEEPLAQAVLISAPAGAGKSRLLHELIGKLYRRARPPSVWIGRGDPLRAGSALGMLAQVLRGVTGILEGEPLERRREKLTARVARHLPPEAQRRVTEFLGEIVGAHFPDDASAPLNAARKDPQLMSDQLGRAFIEFLQSECSSSPVLLVLEDLHWGDLSSVRLVDEALRALEDAPLLVLALARPEIVELFPRIWAERRLQSIHLKELGTKASERLVRHVLGNAVDARTTERIVSLAQGNAFYLEELIRAAAEGRSEAMPETVVAMVQSRLGALADEDRRILRAASIFGENFWRGGVLALLGEPEREREIRERLANLVAEELCAPRRDSRFPGEDELSFRHALLREGAYAMLTEEDRALGHALAGAWLEACGESDPLVLAEHFERGGEGLRAGAHYLRASEVANRAGDSGAARARARQGLACEVTPELRARLLGVLCESTMWHTESAHDVLAEAEEVLGLAEAGSAPWLQGACAKLMGSLYAGDMVGFSTTISAIEEVEPDPEAAGTWVLCLIAATYVPDHIGWVRRSDALLARRIALAEILGTREPTVPAWAHILLGVRDAYAKEDPWSALQHAQAADELSRACAQSRLSAIARVLVGMSQWYLGATRQAEETFATVTLRDEEVGYGSSVRPFVRALLLAEGNAIDEAQQVALELVERGRARKLPLEEGRGKWALAEALRRGEDHAGAVRAIESAIEIFRTGVLLDLPGALGTLAALRLAEGKAEEALATAEEGMALYATIGACGMFRGAALRLTHAECLAAAGRREEAQAAIKRAVEQLEAIAGKIPDAKYRTSFLQDVPENRRTMELGRGSTP